MNTPRNIGWFAALTWALACAALASRFASAGGIISALLGGLFGALLADSMARSTSIRRFALLLVAAACLTPYVASMMPLAAMHRLALIEGTDLASRALLAIWIVRVLSVRLTWFRPWATLLAALAFAQWMAAHRYGNLSRPYAWMDAWIEHGHKPSDLLWLMGAAVTLLVSSLLVPNLRAPGRRASVFTIVTMVLAALILSRWAPQLPFAPPRPPPPPRSQAPEPPPPPPPDPHIIALVQFEDTYQPPVRLGGYFLRTHAASRINHLQIEADAHDDATPDSVADASTTGSAIATTGVIRTRILMLDATNRIPELVNSRFRSVSGKPSEPFQRAIRCQSAALGTALASDLDMSTFRQRLTDARWMPEQLAYYTQASKDAQIQQLVNELVGDMPADIATYLPPRVKVIRHWLNQRCAYSANAGQKTSDDPITNFLFQTRIGGARQFATAAVLLFRSAGIPARLAFGYVVPVAPTETRSELVVSDTHAKEWPEVYLDGTGWVPVPLNPTNVLDRPQPAPDPELEARLRDHADKTDAPPKRRWANGPWLQRLGIAALLALSALMTQRLFIRYLSVAVSMPGQRHHRALRATRSLAAAAGCDHQPGETYYDWCQRICDQERTPDKRLSKLLREVVTRYRTCYETGSIETVGTWIRLLLRLDKQLWLHAPLRRLSPFCAASFGNRRPNPTRPDKRGPHE